MSRAAPIFAVTYFLALSGKPERNIVPRDTSTTQKERVLSMFEDKTLVCKECGNEFVFTAGEQEFYAEHGFQNEPQR